MNSLTSSCWSSWCCRIWMRALTLEPEYWLVLDGLMAARADSSSSDTIGVSVEAGILSVIVTYRVSKNISLFIHLCQLVFLCCCQTHHHLPRCSSHLCVLSEGPCRTDPKVWSQFVSWGSQGAWGYSSVGNVEIMQGWLPFPATFPPKIINEILKCSCTSERLLLCQHLVLWPKEQPTTVFYFLLFAASLWLDMQQTRKWNIEYI